MRVLKNTLLLAGVAAGVWSAPQTATVSADAIAVHSKASAESPARGSLERGDSVVINMVLQTNRGAWCDITKARDGAKAALSGYVQCSQLEERAVDEIYRKAAATPANPDEAIGAALRLSGFTEQAAGLSAVLDGSLTRTISRDRLTPQQQAAVTTSVKRAMTPEKLTAAVTARLKAGYAPDTLAAVLESLQSPISRKMTQLEVHEDLQSANPAVAEAFGAQLAKSPPTRNRQILIDRIVEASGSSGAVVDVMVGIFRGIMAGFGASPDQIEAEMARSMMARSMKEIPRELKDSTVERISLFYSFRSASDAELAQYADVLDSPALRWFNSTVRQGFVDFAQQSGTEIVKNLGIKTPPR